MTIQTEKEAERKPNFARKYLPTVARILLGLLFLMAGTFGLLMSLHLMPLPPANLPAGAAAFSGALAKTGYMMQLSSATDFIVGVLLLTNRFVPLALALIAPVIVNIFAFHLFLAPSGIGAGIFAAVLEIYLAWTYRKTYRPMLAMKVAPDAR